MGERIRSINQGVRTDSGVASYGALGHVPPTYSNFIFMSTTHSSFDQYCIRPTHKTISHRAVAAPGPEARRECPMTSFPASPLLATNPDDATV